MADENFDFSDDAALKVEASLEVNNSEAPFKDYTPSYELIEKSTLQWIDWVLED